MKYAQFLGQNVAQEVLDLMSEVKKKNPMLGFEIGGNRYSFFDDQDPPQRVEIKLSLRVHDISDPSQDIGSIGFDHDGKYWVRSRLIQNEKYGHWNKSQHESKYSKHMKNIIKEASRTLKPFTYAEVKQEQSGNIDRHINERCRQMRHKAAQKVELKFADLFTELLHLSYTGYTPKSPKVAEAMQYAVANKEELEKFYDYNPKRCMIWVRPNSVVYELDKETKCVNAIADLPEDLRGKLFVLDVTDAGQFVEDVGIKQENGIYWVLL
jgi:hypothetical protein